MRDTWQRWRAVAHAAGVMLSFGAPAEWYAVTNGFHYDESTPYVAGQNRGIDATVKGGDVRAISDGVVRFSDTVAGRGVVTVATRHPTWGKVVVTYTGVTPGVFKGQRVAFGQRIANGRSLHLGIYDAQVRHRYYPPPLLQRRAAPARGNGMAVAVGDRLLAAIEGRVAARTQSTAAPTRAAAGMRGAALLARDTGAPTGGMHRGAVRRRPPAGHGSTAEMVRLAGLRAPPLNATSASPPRTVRRVSGAVARGEASTAGGNVDDARAGGVGAVAVARRHAQVILPGQREHASVWSHEGAGAGGGHRVTARMAGEHALRGVGPTTSPTSVIASAIAALAGPTRSEAQFDTGGSGADSQRATREERAAPGRSGMDVDDYVVMLALLVLAAFVVRGGRRWLALRRGGSGGGSGAFDTDRHLGAAAGADRAFHELLEVARLAAEHAAVGRLGEDDAIALHVYLDWVALVDAKPLANLDGNDDTAEFVDLSDDSCVLHGGKRLPWVSGGARPEGRAPWVGGPVERIACNVAASEAVQQERAAGIPCQPY